MVLILDRHMMARVTSSRRRWLGAHVARAMLESCAAMDVRGRCDAAVGICGGGMLAMLAITCASVMSRWTAATNGWRSIASGVPSRVGIAGVTDGSGAWSMRVGMVLSRARLRPAPSLLGPRVVWNAGAPAWSVGEVCPCVRLLQRGVGRPAAGDVGTVGLRETMLSAPPRRGSGGGGRRWSMPDGGEEEGDEVEVDGMRRLLPFSGDVGEVWFRWVRGEELNDACAGRRRERGRRVPANAVHDGKPARGHCLRVCSTAGEVCRDGLDSFLGREVVRVDLGRSSHCPRIGVGSAVAIVCYIKLPCSCVGVGPL